MPWQNVDSLCESSFALSSSKILDGEISSSAICAEIKPQKIIKGKRGEIHVQFKEVDSDALDKLVLRTTETAHGMNQITNLTKKVGSKVERLEQEITAEKFEMQQTIIKLNETRKFEMQKMEDNLKTELANLRTELANQRTELDALK